jgi:hypothetical protein
MKKIMKTKVIFMNCEPFLSDSSRATIDIATDEVLKNRQLFEEVVYLSLNENTKFALRASRVLHFCSIKRPDLIEPYLSEFLNALKNNQNDSIRGNFLSIFYKIELPYDEDFLCELTQICFELLNGQRERESLAVYSIDVLCKICKFYPELKNELIQNLQSLIPHKKAAFQCRANRALDILRKTKSNINC